MQLPVAQEVQTGDVTHMLDMTTVYKVLNTPESILKTVAQAADT